MKQYLAAALALGFFAAPGAQAAETTAVLDVHHAGCVLCGPIIKSTLEHVKGVKAVQVAQPNGDADVTATVTFDGTATNVAALVSATTNAGYPSAPKG
jgi:copper chaperone CopZ